MQAYVEAERSQISAILDASGGVYKTMTVESSDPNSVAFSYTYANQLDAATVAAELDKVASQFQQACDDQMLPGMRAFGIKGEVNVSYIYLNLDGSEIWRKDLTCSGASGTPHHGVQSQSRNLPGFPPETPGFVLRAITPHP